MRQVTGRISTYSSDEFGICSALYELGGMVVMHDASGCNSTYTTHDEPRWYDMDSMIFISAISEIEAIMGDDDKFINDLIETAEELHPKFIALVGAPIPYMIGTDLDAIAAIVSDSTGIPCFGFAANGMNYYTKGVSMALERVVKEFCEEQKSRMRHTKPVVNILGATPLDFSLNKSVDSIQGWITDHDMENGVCLSMGCTLEDIAYMADADVNLVISYGGLAAAEYLEEKYGIPYVAGVPFGEKFSEYLASEVRKAAITKESRIGYQIKDGYQMEAKRESCIDYKMEGEKESCINYQMEDTKESHIRESESTSLENDGRKKETYVLIGESVFAASLAAALETDLDINIRVLCPLDTKETLLREGDVCTPEEDDILAQIKDADGVIADPLYRPVIENQKFIELPHEAFSGRIYDAVNPNLIARSLRELIKV